uniref:Lipoyl synthase n=1 Tax=Anthurium amnicola TaxID=1678845 RepID=A0A1D1ZDS8_9ARAE
MAMASLPLSLPIISTNSISRYRFPSTAGSLFLGQKIRYPFYRAQFKTVGLHCTKLYPWETSPTDAPAGEGASIIKGSSIFESIKTKETDDIPILENVENVIDMKVQPPMQHEPLKWPMWLLGPMVLLLTGMVPTLWLPLSSVFLGANIAGVLALVGLDCIFNMGATLFLLMADACARRKRESYANNSQVPLTYMFWNMGANVIGFIVPLGMLLASYRGHLLPQLPSISFVVLFGPYLLLLSTQMLTEMLTWHWKSPVWLVTPVVYEAYRVLQLMRGLRLGTEVGVPAWTMDTIRGLVSWWVLILGIQLMRVAWFAGYVPQIQEQP